MTKMMLGGRMDEVLEMVLSNYRHLNEVIKYFPIYRTNGRLVIHLNDLIRNLPVI
jgi:hypothetical protein